MQRTLTALAILIACTFTTFADTSQFQGLYYPPADTTGSWSCSADDIGQYGGALGVKKDILYGTEWSCQLSSAKQTEDGTQFFGECSAEGTDYRDIITLRKTANGVNVKTEDGELEWRSCEADSAQSNGPSNWATGFGMGVAETTVSNDSEEKAIFSCGVGTSEPLIGIFVQTVNSFTGPVAIVIDGTAYNFEAVDSSIDIDTDCADCMKNYMSMMNTLFKGSSMTIVPNLGSPITFAVNGAKTAFNGETCEQEAKAFRETISVCSRVGCTATVEKKVSFGKQRAGIKARVTEDDARDFCTLYAYPDWQNQDQEGKVKICIRNQMKEFGDKPFWIRADCAAGQVTNGFGVTYQKDGFDNFGEMKWRNITNPFPNERIPFEINSSYWELLCNG